jgi:hypothetical protein
MSPNPALVSQQAVQRLPRLALLLFCAAYVLPGVFHRDPWRHADITAFGAMANLAQGKAAWLAPTVGGLPLDGALLPHWLGAAAIMLLSPWIDPPLAARLAFAALLTLTLVLTWYTTFHLARTAPAQPLPFAFGGEARPMDYARAIADGALLALVATLGLLQLGHETTPELAQLFAVALALWSLAAAPYRGWRARLAALLSLPMLAASGAPSMALAMGAFGTVLHWHCRRQEGLDGHWLWLLAGTTMSALAGAAWHSWQLHWDFEPTSTQLGQIGRLLLWFLWPAWALALWTLWRWRRQLLQRHLSIPLGIAGISLLACIAMGGSDRALMLSVPAVAVLAAFALPTFQRSTAAAIDWFSVFFFSICAVIVWVLYAAMQTGFPPVPAANVARLAPGFKAPFVGVELLIALAGTVAWLWLVRWRTGRHRAAVWKSLVLPAGGVALCWLLVMTLWLPVLDYARSYRPWVQRVAQVVPRASCVAAPGVRRSQLAALEYFGRYRVQGEDTADDTRCPVLLLVVNRAALPSPAGWRLVGRVQPPTDRHEWTGIYRRASQ